ncbi:MULTISPECIES: adenosine deaminase [Terrabacteria group]|uniref:adenosine deaminase n=1 Tax=Bacillati TaxID=1783272 RepID=UPI001C6E1CEA|nr:MULTISPECIES: adenosine deaminase [Terrabacteria group]MBW9212206.1 adenosine deaminase [Trueperella sp. zg.1013]
MSEFSFPKIDLHLHLDGSFRMKTVWELAMQKRITMPTNTLSEYKEYIRRCSHAKSVNEYLKMFDHPLKVMQDEASLIRITKELIEDLAKQNLRYAEIRFAPQLHTQQGLSQTKAIEAVLEGRKQALFLYPGIQIGIITCMMSLGPISVNKEANLETIELCQKYLGKGVVALDLAGAEGIVALSDFRSFFIKAKELGIPCTCHAGDSEPVQSIQDAIDFGVQRIGHGHHLIDNLKLCQTTKEKHILLEICPTSNVQCQTVPSYQKHPVKKLYDLGVPVSINTDNMTLAGVTLEDEYRHCINEMGFRKKDIIQMNLYAIQSAFISDYEKQEIIQELKQALKEAEIC